MAAGRFAALMEKAYECFSSRGFAVLLCIVMLSSAGGCIFRNGDTVLIFHAGAGQRSSLDEIRNVYMRLHPGVEIDFNYKGSGYFLADLARSHEGDLYMPGEEFYLLQALQRGYVASYDPAKDVVASFVTVALTPRGNPAGIRSVMDFARPGVRVGIGNPQACAIGLWHEKIFKRAGIWEAVRRNAVMSAKCIPELGNAAQHRAVDATIVWATTAVLYLRDCEIIPLAPKYTGVVRLPVARLVFSRHPEEADRLKSFILSREGRRIFAKHAYFTEDVKVDEDGFCLDGEALRPLFTCLVQAAAAVKEGDRPLSSFELGPLKDEVLRQRKTVRAGD